MAQEKHKALDQRNFHQDEAEAHGDEIKQSDNSSLRNVLATAMQRQRQNQKGQHGHNRDDQQHSQHDNAQVDAPVHAASCTGQNIFNYVPRLQREKEKRS